MITIQNPCIIAENGKELVEHGTSLFPLACYYDDLNEGVVPWHWHEELELIYVREGMGIFRTDTDEYVLGKGDGCFFNSCVLHEAVNKGDVLCRTQSIVFDARLVGGYPGSVFWQDYILPITDNASLRMLPLSMGDAKEKVILDDLLAVMRECDEAEPAYEFRVRNYLSDMVIALRGFVPETAHELSPSLIRSEERLKDMIEYIRTNLEDELTVEKIAASASISKTECIRCFRLALGTSPKRYVRQLRLHKAAGLLASTDMRVAEIGAECGFQEMSYFAREFREQFGLLPMEYRKARREKDE